ncbi:hypothetical protein BpHYR1_020185 [Brachionus plicatilis]|uniref:RNA-directed DNA polymerase from mobile element jockey-like n=1 Tax=Brachionus plicatilis TaxID=10195 RepID=A0A3M7PX22_BRAPC|nr:hypothetical protein BpHYR1_020185 [Brachionus plicatilis]
MNSNLNFDSIATENFRKVNNKFFSISYLGLEQKNISPALKSFIYKTYCLSKFTYAWRRKKNLKIKKSKKIFIQEKFFDFEILFSSLKNLSYVQHPQSVKNI